MVALLPRLAYSSVLTVLNCACYGLNKLYTASTGYTGNHKPSGHSSALAALGSLQLGPQVHDFPYIPRTQCITVIYIGSVATYNNSQTDVSINKCFFFFYKRLYYNYAVSVL